MGEPNNALKAYMKRPDRIRSVLEYYLGEKLPEDWECSQTDAFLPVRDTKGKLTFRERDYLGEARAWGIRFLLGLENQQTVNLTFPWRLMEMDCLTYGKEIEAIQEKNEAGKVQYGPEDDFILQTARIYIDAFGKVLGWRSAVGSYCKFSRCAV